MTVAECVGHLVDVLAGRRLVEPPLRLLVQRLVHLAPRRVLLQIPFFRRSTFEPIFFFTNLNPLNAMGCVSVPQESVEIRPSQDEVDAGLVVEVAEHAQDVWVPQVGL